MEIKPMLTNPISWIFSHIFAIVPEMLETIIGIASREINIDAIKSKTGQPVPKTYKAENRDGVAIIDIVGPIFPRANLFSNVSGVTSIEVLAKDFTEAVNNPNIKAVLFNIDSPGGEATGVSEFADMVYNARSKKTIVAYTYGQASSAAYWIFTAAEKRYVSDTAIVGSIGVIMAQKNTDAQDEKNGIKTYEIVSSKSPDKRLDAGTESGKAKIQILVDNMTDIFINKISRNMGVTTETVLNDFGKGGVLLGSFAVDAGMADQVSNLEDVINLLNEKKYPILNQPTKGVTSMDYELFKAQHPELFARVRNEGVAEGVATERTRLQAIDSLKVVGYDALIAENKYKPDMSKEKIAILVLEAQSSENKRLLAARKKAGHETTTAFFNVGNSVPITIEETEEKLDAEYADGIASAMNKGGR
jgi:ClpP class serine protease